MLRVDLHVFSAGSEAREAIEQVLTDRRLAKARPAYFGGSMAEAAQKYAEEASPGLLIIETHDGAPALFDQLDRLSEVCRPETNLILLGAHNDVQLYRQIAKRGVHDYVPMPIDPAHLIEAILGVCASPDETRQARLISFIGASGGAGSSTLANNIAWQLGKLYDDEVILADLDLAFGTVALDYNLESPQTTAQALAQADRLDDQMIERFLAKYNDNLRLLTSSGDCESAAEVDLASVDLLIRTLRRNAAWVVLDLPHCWTGWVRHILDMSDEVVLTAVPSLASLRNAKSAADILNAGRKNDTRVRIALNRIGASAKSEIRTSDFAATLGSAPAVLVPYEPALFAEAANAGHMIGETSKGQRVIEPFGKLSTLVSGRPGAERRKQGKGLGLLEKITAWSTKPVLRWST
ncbi:MAG TPA: cellulose synthase operon protein YhjQ/BcsQ [Alphaproteobacteria bacterium]|nr:cellulose synthase operon protein YhjQ/BcsQ [Alphaproteobacteria bacterium]